MEFRSVFDQLPVALAIHREERILYLNREMARVLGRDSPDALLAMAMSDLIRACVHPDEVADALARMRALDAGQSPPPAARRFVRPDGGIVAAETASSHIDFDGQPAVLTLVHDLAEQREMQARLLLSDRMASVGRLAAGVAHEINNPLTYVTGNVGFAITHLGQITEHVETRAPEESAEAALLSVVAQLEDVREALEEARQGTNRVRQIVRDLKTFSRADDERRGPADVRRLMESCINMAWNEIRHRARLVKLYGETPRVEVSESRLGQVFLNLLINAAQAIPEGSADENEIRVTTGVDPMGRVAVEIRDTGRGIAPENLGRIFDPFFTTKPVGEGTGLGLAIVHRIVTTIGGEISVESEIGRGTAFRVALPASLVQRTRSGVVAAVARPPRRCRALVVDDEPLVVRAVKRMLGADGHDVVTAGNGREALALLQAGERPDAILCDLMMPEMTGMDLYANLTRTMPDLAQRMVFMTGGTFTTGAQAFLVHVTNPHLEKPFEAGALRETLRIIVG